MSKFIQSFIQRATKVLEQDIQGSFDINGIITVTNSDGTKQVWDGHNMHKLSIEDITKQLIDVDSIKYEVGTKYLLDYFDVVIRVYSKQLSSYSSTFDVVEKERKAFNISVIGRKFFTVINDLFNDSSKEETLRSLGAQDIDFSLMRKHYTQIEENLNTGLDILKISIKLRFLEIALNINDNNQGNTLTSDFDAICCKIQGYPNLIPIIKIHEMQEPFMPNPLNCLNASAKTLAIFINDRGGFSWNSKMLDKHYGEILAIFDEVIIYGNGDRDIYLDEALDILTNANSRYKDMKLVMITLLKHGDRKDMEIQGFIDDLPDSFSSKETIYIIDSCYADHTDYSKNAFLVTFDSGIIKHNTSANLFYDGRFTALLQSNMTNNHNAIDSILEYYGTKKDVFSSIAYISGNMNGTNIHKIPIHQLYNEFHPDISQHHLIDPRIAIGEFKTNVADTIDYISDNNYNPCIIL